MTIRAEPCVQNLVLKGVNAKATGNTLIAVTDANMRFAVISTNYAAATLTGAATGPTFSIGTNSTTFDNIRASSVWSPTTVNKKLGQAPASTTISVAPGTSIFLRITSAATSTTMTMDVIVSGVYF